MSHIKQNAHVRKENAQQTSAAAYTGNLGVSQGGYIATYAHNVDSFGPMLIGGGGNGVTPYAPSSLDAHYLSVYNAQQLEHGLSSGSGSGSGNNVGSGAVPGYYAGMSSTAQLVPPNTFGALVSVPYGFQGLMPCQGIAYSTADAYGSNRTIPIQQLRGDVSNIFAMSTPGEPIQTTKDLQGPEGCNLFVFHIPNDMSNRDLYFLFREYGEVISARIMVDKATGRSRGFGFVSFSDRKSAEDAIKGLNGCHIGHKRLKVQHKKEKDRPEHPSALNSARDVTSSCESSVPLHYYRQAFIGTEQIPSNVSAIVESTPSEIQLPADGKVEVLADRFSDQLNVEESSSKVCRRSTDKAASLEQGMKSKEIPESHRAPIASIDDTCVDGYQRTPNIVESHSPIHFASWISESQKRSPSMAASERSI